MSETYNKAMKRLAKLVGIDVKVIMADGEETDGILDSFFLGNASKGTPRSVSFIVLDDSYTGAKRIINFDYIYMISEKEKETP